MKQKDDRVRTQVKEKGLQKELNQDVHGRLWASSAEGTGLMPGPGTKIPHATWPKQTEELKLPAPWPWTASLQKHEEVNFCGLSHAVCGFLLWQQLWQINWPPKWPFCHQFCPFPCSPHGGQRGLTTGGVLNLAAPQSLMGDQRTPLWWLHPTSHHIDRAGSRRIVWVYMSMCMCIFKTSSDGSNVQSVLRSTDPKHQLVTWHRSRSLIRFLSASPVSALSSPCLACPPWRCQALGHIRLSIPPDPAGFPLPGLLSLCPPLLSPSADPSSSWNTGIRHHLLLACPLCRAPGHQAHPCPCSMMLGAVYRVWGLPILVDWEPPKTSTLLTLVIPMPSPVLEI